MDKDVPDNRKLKIYLFCCTTSFDPVELELALRNRGYDLKTLPMPCSGKIDILYLTKAFETGADGAAILTCKKGECHYLEGNLRARKRSEAVEALLEETGIGKGRVRLIQMDEGGMKQVIAELNDFLDDLRRMPVDALSGNKVAVS